MVNVGMERKRLGRDKKKNKPIGTDHSLGSVFDFGVLGCSVSWGYAYGKHYSALIQQEGYTVLNAAVVAAGMDSIYINLKYILTRFSFKKIIILLPNFERKIYRHQTKYGTRCLIPITVHRQEPFYQKTVSDLCSARITRYSKKFFHKIEKHCEYHGSKLYVSSWDSDVMNWLQGQKARKFNLLPYFEKVDVGDDHIHPGIRSHQIWYDKIKDIVISP